MAAAKLDPTLADGVEQARRAAEDEAGDPRVVGAHEGVVAADDRVALHRFRCLLPAYRGWFWEVQVSRAPRAKTMTIDDVCLLPGADALLAPPWVPWSERLRPGDLGVGDLLPTAADDERLAPRFTDALELVDADLFIELGLGRERVLSEVGRTEAAERWYDGDPGPRSPVARAAPAMCGTCGFYVALVGALGQAFGVCANAFAPDDARVVAADHGCGAHSQALVLPSGLPTPGVPGVADVEPPEPYGHS